jgi:hypothetical protein
MRKLLQQFIVAQLVKPLARGLDIVPTPLKAQLTAPCPLCSHQIECSQVAFRHPTEGDDDLTVIVCYGCLAVHKVRAGSFQPLKKAEVRKLPREAAEFVAQTQALYRAMKARVN